MPHQGIEPASAVCRSDALLTELHPHLVPGPGMATYQSITTSPAVATCTPLINFTALLWSFEQCNLHSSVICSQLKKYAKIVRVKRFASDSDPNPNPPKFKLSYL